MSQIIICHQDKGVLLSRRVGENTWSKISGYGLHCLSGALIFKSVDEARAWVRLFLCEDADNYDYRSLATVELTDAIRNGAMIAGLVLSLIGLFYICAQ